MTLIKNTWRHMQYKCNLCLKVVFAGLVAIGANFLFVILCECHFLAEPLPFYTAHILV